jgi:hypothetical protein
MVRRCHRVLSRALVGALLLIAGTVAAADQPSGKVSLYVTSVAAGVGAQWGRGTLTLSNGKQYDFTVQGLEVGGVGFADARAEGQVYNLRNLSDFNGVYVAAEANAAIGDGPGARTMRNEHGVVINLSSAQTGVKLTLAGEGVRIALKE